MSVNWVDVAILVLLLVSGIFAFLRGFVHEALSVGAWIGAALATLYGFPYAQPYARQVIAIEILADFAAGVAIFLLVLVLLWIVTHAIGRRVQESSLGPLDRALGFLFGLLRGAVLVAVAWLAFALFLPLEEDWPEAVREARSRPLVEAGAALLASLLPESFRAQGEEAIDGAMSKSTEEFQQLIIPAPETDAPENQGEYNQDMRQDMERLIEPLLHNPSGSGSPERQEAPQQQ